MTETSNSLGKPITRTPACPSWLAAVLTTLAWALLGLLLVTPAARAQNAAQRTALGQIFRPAAVEPNGVEATTVPLAAPAALAYDSLGNLFIASLDDHVIRKVDLAGIITTVAGNGEQGFGGDGGPATSAILDSPAGIAIDAAGNLFIADTHNERIREVTASTGIIATVAGTGVAGFSGDQGAATSASLNLPTAIALDATGGVYVADTGNHRIRKITGATITTVAGDGEQFYSGDGGAATAAGLDSPEGLAVDAAGNIYVGDTHNHRIRIITAATGIISTVAGTGTKSFGGDNASATAAGLARPRGVALDSTGTLYIADSDNNRIRTLSGTTIATFAGTGEQGFSGDIANAKAAILDTPRDTALFSSGSDHAMAFTDSHNDRVRAISTTGTINTIAGLAPQPTPSLLLNGAPSVVYGTGSLTATFSDQGRTGTGTVTLLEGTTVLGTGTLSANATGFTLPPLPVGTHLLTARYGGDGINPAGTSGVFVLTVTPASVIATAQGVSIAFGLPIPPLTGALSGVLSFDAGNVTAVFSSTAVLGSTPGTYPITATLQGSAASNYVLTLSPASGSVVIVNAPTTTTLSASATSVYAGASITFTANVAPSNAGTVGVLAGTVTFFAGSTVLGTATLDQSGTATLVTTQGAGVYPVTAVYNGSSTFNTSTSAPLTVTVLPIPDYTIAAAAPTSQTVVPGGSLNYNINVIPNPSPFTNVVVMSVSGLPPGATATFAPPTLTPNGNITSTVMTVKTAPLTATVTGASGLTGMLALTLLLLPLARRRNALRGFTRITASILLCLGTAGMATLMSGCVRPDGFFGQPEKVYILTVTGTSTSVTGATLVRTTTVTLTLQ